MTRMKTSVYLVLGLLVAPGVSANDFPTQARVEYVLRCMDAHGGQTYDNLYPCICSVDKLAQKVTYDEYAQGEVFIWLRRTPGERGGVFRDPEQAESLYEILTAAIASAEESCFVNQKAAKRND